VAAEAASFDVHVQLQIFDVGSSINGGCPVEEIVVEVTKTEHSCDLCYHHSCDEIEKLEFDVSALNQHQRDSIAFGFDKLHFTSADTIGGCLFCEDGSSSNPNQCVFKQPEEIGKIQFIIHVRRASPRSVYSEALG
jgi:hypothetical protein